MGTQVSGQDSQPRSADARKTPASRVAAIEAIHAGLDCSNVGAAARQSAFVFRKSRAGKKRWAKRAGVRQSTNKM